MPRGVYRRFQGGQWLAAAGVLWLLGGVAQAMPLPSAIEGTVTDATSGEPLKGWSISASLRYSGGGGDSTDEDGLYHIGDLWQGTYTVSPMGMPPYMQPDAVEVELGPGETATVDFALERVPVDIAIDVVQPSGGQRGGMVEVQYKLRFQPMCYEPTKVYAWAWDPVSERSFMLFAEEGFSVGYHYSDMVQTTYPNPYTQEVTLRFGWDTRMNQNGLHLVKAAAEFSNPFGPPFVLGSPPPNQQAQGTSGGADGSVDILNMVITSYTALNANQDYLKYDPDGSADLARPQVVFTIEDADPAPMQCVLFAAETGKSSGDAFAPDSTYWTAMDVSGPGTYTITWDGSWSPGGQPDAAPWGTYSYDIYAYKSNWQYPYDTTAAKWPYTLWVPDSIIQSGQSHPGHEVWWEWPVEASAPELRCSYVLVSMAGVDADETTLYAVDPLLTERGTVSGPTTVNVLHAGPAGEGIPTVTAVDNEDATGTWRVVFGAQCGNGAEWRRDRTNPRMLAFNRWQQTKYPWFLYHCDGDEPESLDNPDNSAHYAVLDQAFATTLGARVGRWRGVLAMEAAGTCTTSDDAAAYVQNWVKAARGRQVVCITMVQKEGGGQPGMTFNNHAGSITDPKRSWFCNEEIIADADRPNNEPATLARARTHTMIHEFCHSLGLSFGCDGTTRCILRESLEQYFFEDMGAEVFGPDSHRNRHRTQIRGALGHEIRD